jgi:hypothetical protein
MTPRTTLAGLVAAIALLGVAAPAEAAFFPGQTVDGPSPAIERLGNVSVARDGTGSLVYEKQEALATHVFFARLSDGNPMPPERVDVGQAGDSSEAQVSAAPDGRALVSWVNGGDLYAAHRPSENEPFSPPERVFDATGAGVSESSLSMSQHGVGYVAFTTGTAPSRDIRVAVLQSGSWTVIPTTVDVDGARDVRVPKIVASSDGTALVAWVEDSGRERVFARRVIRDRLSDFPKQVSIDALDGRPELRASPPSFDVEDVSDFAWVTIAQTFDDAGTPTTRVYARRMVGSDFEAPVAIDGQGFPVGDTPTSTAFDMSGRGRGLAALGFSSNGVGGAAIQSDEFLPTSRLEGGASSVDPRPVAAISEIGRGTVAWERDPGPAGPRAIVGRYWDAQEWNPEGLLSPPELGPSDASLGLSASANSGGDQAIAFVQGEPALRRIVAGVFDREPRRVGGETDRQWRRDRRPMLRWSEVADQWGRVRYRVEIDGQPVAETNSTRFQVPTDLPDGAHAYMIVPVDSRGQATEGPEREFRIDTTDPTGRLRVAGRAGRRVTLDLSAFDGTAIQGSGIARVVIRFGDGARAVVRAPNIGIIEGARVRHTYRGGGSSTARATIIDRAGNRGTATVRVR